VRSTSEDPSWEGAMVSKWRELKQEGVQNADRPR
jgi:hypothetical protein